jgi:hypothetical protein
LAIVYPEELPVSRRFQPNPCLPGQGLSEARVYHHEREGQMSMMDDDPM